MKTREQIYGQEAAGILRDVSMYRALTEMQLLKLYPHKESKIRNLLSYLQKQGRIVQRGEYYRIPADAEAGDRLRAFKGHLGSYRLYGAGRISLCQRVPRKNHIFCGW